MSTTMAINDEKCTSATSSTSNAVSQTPLEDIKSSQVPPMPPVDTTLPPHRMVGAYTQDRALEDLPGIKHALDLFLASHMVESEEFCHASDLTKDRLYFASGYGLIQCVKALMSYEDEDLLAAIGHTRHGNNIAQQHRKKAASLASRVAGLVIGSTSSSGVGWIKSMTDVERHAELIYAETLFEKALLGIMYSGDWLSFIKEALNLRSTFTTYRLLHKYVKTMDHDATARGGGPQDKSIDADFRSGVLLGAGMSNIILTLMPSRLLSIVELFGFKGNRDEGLALLYEAGGWLPASDPNAAKPTVSVTEEGVRRSICDMSLLIFHLVLSSFTSSGVDIARAQNILNWNLTRYPQGVFFLFGQGRLYLIRGKPKLAIESYRKAMTSQEQFRNLHQISWWEMSIANLALYDVSESLPCWRSLEKESTWSKACYAYGIAVCLIELGGKENLKEASDYLEKLPSLLQRIAGKSIPMEKFVARKARKFKKQNGRLALPALEYAYFFLAISRAPRSIIEGKMLPAIHALQEKLEDHVRDPTSYEGGQGYWDDYCLASFLEGVCYRYIAYPDGDALIDPLEKIETPKADAEARALTALQLVLSNGPKIELDHQLVYYGHFELGRLNARMGNKDEARKHFDLVLSGKPLEVNASTRKGKFSLESALMMRSNAALEALDNDKPL